MLFSCLCKHGSFAILRKQKKESCWCYYLGGAIKPIATQYIHVDNMPLSLTNSRKRQCASHRISVREAGIGFLLSWFPICFQVLVLCVWISNPLKERKSITELNCGVGSDEIVRINHSAVPKKATWWEKTGEREAGQESRPRQFLNSIAVIIWRKRKDSSPGRRERSSWEIE